MQTDTLMYRLVQERPRLALAWVGAPETADYRMKAIEVKQSAFRLDGVLLPLPERQDAPVIFAEAQFQPDSGFAATRRVGAKNASHGAQNGPGSMKSARRSRT